MASTLKSVLIFFLVNGWIRNPDPNIYKKNYEPGSGAHKNLFCVQYTGTESSWDELREDPLPDEDAAKDWCMRLLLVSKSRLCAALPAASSRSSWFSFPSRGERRGKPEADAAAD
jgi:hypothetical protein